MDTSEAILGRRSVRAYKAKRIEEEKINKILQAGIRAPSGKNGQPWCFAVVQEDKMQLRKIAEYTVNKSFVCTADCLICVFLDKENSYDYMKDCQAIGACIENLLLAATDSGFGSCWIGEILKHEKEIKGLLELSDRYDLMAVIALGYPASKKGVLTPRKPLDETMLLRK